jgi:epoxyqueuosine reductase
MDATRIARIVAEFIQTSPENSLKNEAHEPAWEEALLGFSAAPDPIYQAYKEHVGPFHFTRKRFST